MDLREIFEGQCQCGQVSYRLTGESVACFVCHCSECQRQSASAFGMALWLRNFHKDVVGRDLGVWVRTTPSDKRLVCEFCRECGTRMFHQMSDQDDTLSVKPGTLNTTVGLEPVAHIWTSRAQSWVQLPPRILSYPQNPPSFEAIFAAWRARGKNGVLAAKP